MLAKVGIAIAAPFLGMALLVGATGVMVVDVQEGGADGTHFVIPVPLVLAQAAMTLAPADAKYIECPEFAPYQDLTEKVLEELDDIPDAVLVEVQEAEESVRVWKEGSLIHVSVEDGGDQVECRFPIKSALQVVRAYDGNGFPTKAAIWGLRRAPMGTLVNVQDGQDKVKISMF
jgi:hypothetical protein